MEMLEVKTTIMNDQMKKMRRGNVNLNAANDFNKQFQNKETRKVKTRKSDITGDRMIVAGK